jgi:hypothetical protein
MDRVNGVGGYECDLPERHEGRRKLVFNPLSTECVTSSALRMAPMGSRRFRMTLGKEPGFTALEAMVYAAINIYGKVGRLSALRLAARTKEAAALCAIWIPPLNFLHRDRHTSTIISQSVQKAKSASKSRIWPDSWNMISDKSVCFQ